MIVRTPAASLVFAVSAVLAISLSAAADVRTSDRFIGALGVEVAFIPEIGAGSTTSGTFTLSTIPSGARIVRASMYINSWFTPNNPTAMFGGNSLPAGPEYDADTASRAVYVYRWDVTPFVNGSGSYTATAGPVQFSYGLVLLVIFEHPSLAKKTIYVNDGSDSVGPDVGQAIGATTFDNAEAGAGEAWIFVQADDRYATGEQVRFNGTVVGGPLDGNFGWPASLLRLPVVAVQGSNRLELETIEDLFGWHLAVLSYVEECVGGNVNGGVGPVTDVLFVNDSAGGATRRVTGFQHEPFSIFMAAPPAATGPSPYALFAWSGIADQPSVLPGGVGKTCMPMPPSGGHRRLKVVWNNAGRFAFLGVPTLDSSPAPSLVYSDPNGLGRVATFFVQGVIVDSGSPSGLAAVTNGVTVEIR